jgi:hypothetical protein
LLVFAAVNFFLAVFLVVLSSLVITDEASSQQSAPAGPASSVSTVLMYRGVPLDASLLRLDKRALDEAYHAQMLKLFGVWLASGAPDEATNFINGLRIARRAYTQAAVQIARRETELLEQERTRQQNQLIEQSK